MFNKNVIKMTALCLSFFAMLSATVVAQNQGNSPQLEALGLTIPGVDIIVKKKPGGTIVATTKTDRDGKFSVTLPPGEYSITVQGKSFPVAVQPNNTDNASRKLKTAYSPSKGYISAPGSRYKLSLDGEGLTIGADAKAIRDGMEVSYAIKQQGAQYRVADEKTSSDSPAENSRIIKDAGVKISGIVIIVDGM